MPKELDRISQSVLRNPPYKVTTGFPPAGLASMAEFAADDQPGFLILFLLLLA